MYSILTLYIVAVMTTLQPSAPWADRYTEIANGIYQGAKTEPIFKGERGLFRTLALDLSLAWFESRFDPEAIGDNGKSRGLYQVQYRGPNEDVIAQTVRANRMIKQSFAVCHAKAEDERLGWYAAGGNDCERGLKHSRHRMLKAKWIVERFF